MVFLSCLLLTCGISLEAVLRILPSIPTRRQKNVVVDGGGELLGDAARVVQHSGPRGTGGNWFIIIFIFYFYAGVSIPLSTNASV